MEEQPAGTCVVARALGPFASRLAFRCRALASGLCPAALWRFGWLGLAAEAALQRSHQVDDVVAPWTLGFLWLYVLALELCRDHLPQSCLVAILEIGRLEF